MTLIVGSARINENGKTTGGKAGDQTGGEVSTQEYYMHKKGWICLRAKSINVANGLAKAMKQACDNNNIGYCQDHRTNVLTQLRKSGSMAGIAIRTEADCSSLVRGCCIQTGFDPGNFNTETEAAVLEKSGQFEKKFEVTSKTTLYNGDILVTKTKGHTVIVVSGNPRTTSAPSSVEKAKNYSKSYAKTYHTTADLNLRVGAGTKKSRIITMKKGAKAICYGYYNIDKDTGKKWLYVTYTESGKTYTGYASISYLS